MTGKHTVLFGLILAALITAALTISDDLFSPYVSFKEARNRTGQYVQIIGELEKQKPILNINGTLSFTLTDESNNSLYVKAKVLKPVNFEHADKIVVLGKFNTEKNFFEADRLLVKCPSKYKKEK